jgi:hypothetical protein
MGHDHGVPEYSTGSRTHTSYYVRIYVHEAVEPVEQMCVIIRFIRFKVVQLGSPAQNGKNDLTAPNPFTAANGNGKTGRL